MDSMSTLTLTQDIGDLLIQVTDETGFNPIENANVVVVDASDPQKILASAKTDSSGQTRLIELPTPPLSLSLNPNNLEQPYAEYEIIVSKEGYSETVISGSELLANETSIQPISLSPSPSPNESINIPPHTLFGDYPPKIPEAEIKPMGESGEIVLSRVVIPQYVIVHDGVPSDTTAKNYYVPYVDYIKNVVSSEIYATWPETAIYANTLAIQSFTLNRVYTEWYRNQGYDFTITSSTAYDQKWIHGRNIYQNVDRIVDSIFSNYLSRPGITQPIFTSYCDGTTTTCSGLSQWGSKTLGERGFSAIEIIRYYYGNDMYINSTEFISGVPSSWPGYSLSIGSNGRKVRQLQQQLNRIAKNYPLIPTVSVDGQYGPATANAVKTFQRIFGLNDTGITDYPTWYEISRVFVGVSRIAEPNT